MMQELSEQTVRRVAMDLLARREHSYSELLYKLRSRFPVKMAETALQRLAEEGLQSDARFAEAYVYSRANRGYGPVRIRTELMQKGVDQSLIAECLSDDDEQWLEEARRQKQKKFSNTQHLSLKDRTKLYRYLAQRGFMSNQISACMN